MPRPRMYIRVHSWATSLQANLLLYGTTDVRVGSEKPFTISFFANSLSGSVHPCTLPDASFCAAKTSLLIRTPDIRVRSETTRREHKLTAGTLKNERPCSFFSCEFAVRTRFCLEPPPSMALLNSAHPCTLFNVEFAGQTRCCLISRTSLSVLKILSPLAFLQIACYEKSSG